MPGWEEYDECQRDGCDYNTKVEIPANGKHSYVCDVCTTCNELNPVRYTRDGDYIYFGHWPQTLERDENVVAKLNEMAGTPPLQRDNANPYNWESHEGTTYMWQKIVIYNGTKYLGVQMNDYRANGIYGLYDVITDNGYYRLNVYWFKYEPIKWRILTTSGNSAFIMSDIALDFFSMQPDRKIEIRDDLLASYNNSAGVPDGIYANNWEYSFIRSWLNETFYNEVFNDLQKEIIQTTHLDNSARSCNPDEYPKYYGYGENAGKNKYADQCKDTDDKIFLLSLRDVTTTAYGFNKDVLAEDPARNLQASDFAKFHGVSMGNTQKDYVTWYTRSPSLAVGNQGYTTFVLYRDNSTLRHFIASAPSFFFYRFRQFNSAYKSNFYYFVALRYYLFYDIFEQIFVELTVRRVVRYRFIEFFENIDLIVLRLGKFLFSVAPQFCYTVGYSRILYGEIRCRHNAARMQPRYNKVFCGQICDFFIYFPYFLLFYSRSIFYGFDCFYRVG